MNEAGVRSEVNTLFRSLGYNADTQLDAILCPRCHAKVLPPRGKPDVTMVSPTGQSCYVEVKVVRKGELSFPFSRIEPEQRDWLTDWAERDGLSILALGTLEPRKRQLWIVDWGTWLHMESLIVPYQDSIPVAVRPRMLRVLQDNHYDLETLFCGYAAQRITGGWILPPTHPLKELHARHLFDTDNRGAAERASIRAAIPLAAGSD